MRQYSSTLVGLSDVYSTPAQMGQPQASPGHVCVFPRSCCCLVLCVGTSSCFPSSPKRALPVGHGSGAAWSPEPVPGTHGMGVVSRSAPILQGPFEGVRWKLLLLTGLLWGSFRGEWLCRDVELFLAKAPACSQTYRNAAGVLAVAGFTAYCGSASGCCLSPLGLFILFQRCQGLPPACFAFCG